MSPRTEDRIGTFIGIVLLLVLVGVVAERFVNRPRTPLPELPVAYGPPNETPTIDYGDLMGLDPQTQRTIAEKARNNDLEFRVNQLETQVRRLNQIVLRIQEIRIGEQGFSEPEELPAPEPEEIRF